MLGVGPNLLTIPEAWFKWRLFHHCGEDGTSVDLGRAIAFLQRDEKFRLWGIHLPSGGPEAGRGRAVSYASLVTALALEYGRLHGKPGPALWIDHSPRNIWHGLSLLRRFPQAKFVHVIRDGRAVAASVMPLDWGPNTVSEAASYWATRIALG
jgi:hypothetical protein